MIAFLLIIAVTVVVAVALCVRMFRRDDPMLGLVGVGVALVAATMAVAYGGLDSV
jgi:hypothetical protein